MNFAAPETVGGSSRWSDQAREEFFGSLFGGRKILFENDDDDHEHGEEGERDVEEEALRLFR